MENQVKNMSHHSENKVNQDIYDWLFYVKNNVPHFLSFLKGKKRAGFYHYSLSGDYFGEHIKWGLGNASFFLKIVYTLDLEAQYTKEISDAISYIQSFQKKDGYVYDRFLAYVSFPIRTIKGVQARSLSPLYYNEIKRAETRQAISAVLLHTPKFDYSLKDIQKSKKEVHEYLERLDWSKPWHAGSHVSHLLFFLKHAQFDNDELITVVIDWIHHMQQSDGFWYKGSSVSAQEKINGAMKIITGLKVVDSVMFDKAKKIIDFCLLKQHDAHACDNFNIVYVLKYCNEIVQSSYRYDDICTFMLQRLETYKQYYYKEKGGFSFHKERANRLYYHAPVSRGLSEPDIHGTTLFLWGISLIAQVLHFDENMGFKEFTA